MRDVPVADAVKPREATSNDPKIASSAVTAPVSGQAHPSTTPVANAGNLATVQPGAVRGIRRGRKAKIAVSALAATLAVAAGIAWWVQTGNDTSIRSANGQYLPGGVVLEWDGTRWANAYIVSQDGTKVAEVSAASWSAGRPKDQKAHLYTITAINRQNPAQYVTGGTITVRCPATPLPGGQSECEVQPPGVAVQPITTAISTPTPIETEEILNSQGVEKRGAPVEYYELTQKNNPTVESAVMGFGQLSTLFMMSGSYDTNTQQETAETLGVDDNMLEAFFGKYVDANENVTKAWRQRRARFASEDQGIKELSNNTGSLSYALRYLVIGSPISPTNAGDSVRVEIEYSSESNVTRWFPNADYTYTGRQFFTLTLDKNKKDELVWHVSKIESAESDAQETQ
jgi:hypothetical protein